MGCLPPLPSLFPATLSLTLLPAPQDKSTPLHDAISNNSVAVAELLIAKGANVNAEDEVLPPACCLCWPIMKGSVRETEGGDRGAVCVCVCEYRMCLYLPKIPHLRISHAVRASDGYSPSLAPRHAVSLDAPHTPSGRIHTRCAMHAWLFSRPWMVGRAPSSRKSNLRRVTVLIRALCPCDVGNPCALIVHV